jgi:hypothetical protein
VSVAGAEVMVEVLSGGAKDAFGARRGQLALERK